MSKKDAGDKPAQQSGKGKNDKPKGLSNAESQRFEELNGMIEKGMATFREVGVALKEVRDRKLYREHYERFDDYLAEKFGMSRKRASQLICAEDVMEELEVSTIVDKASLPKNEGQVRPLLRLKKGERAQAWKQAVDSSPGKRPVATAVKEVVDGLLKKQSGEASSAQKQTDQTTTGAQKREIAVLVDNSQMADGLWLEGFIDSAVAQTKLNLIGECLTLPVPVKAKVQKVFLEVCETLNQAVEADPSDEMRDGLVFLIGSIIAGLKKADAEPGDMPLIQKAA
jgi:hypothetical protein